MKSLISLLALLLLALPGLAQQDVLPFGVTVGGQAAALTEGSTNHAVIASPVASNAAMAVKGVEGQVIVNIFPADDKGEPKQGAQPHILLFDGKGNKSISDNMQKTKISPGYYLANVVGGGKTSRVLFQVK